MRSRSYVRCCSVLLFRGALISLAIAVGSWGTARGSQVEHDSNAIPTPWNWSALHDDFVSSLNIPEACWTHAIGEPQEDARKRPGPRTNCIDDGEFGGVPVGGFGTGAFTRTYRGDFFRWHLRVGHHRARSMPTC
eukprot:3883832-Pyramimonas_sp.AAC.1